MNTFLVNFPMALFYVGIIIAAITYFRREAHGAVRFIDSIVALVVGIKPA